MENQIENHAPKLNPKSEISLWAGIGSLAPYLYVGVIYLFMPKIPQIAILNFFVAASVLISAPLCIVDGIFFGPISLINGILAIQQIKHNSGNETGYRLAIIGMVLGVLGMIINILLWYVFIHPIISDR